MSAVRVKKKRIVLYFDERERVAFLRVMSLILSIFDIFGVKERKKKFFLDLIKIKGRGFHNRERIRLLSNPNNSINANGKFCLTFELVYKNSSIQNYEDNT